jgi:hypothetical protein
VKALADFAFAAGQLCALAHLAYGAYLALRAIARAPYNNRVLFLLHDVDRCCGFDAQNERPILR